MMVLLSFQRIMLIIHNLFTLDGSGTFYGMGINTSITLGVEVYEIIPWAPILCLNRTQSICKVCLHIYLQQMQTLEVDHPDRYPFEYR